MAGHLAVEVALAAEKVEAVVALETRETAREGGRCGGLGGGESGDGECSAQQRWLGWR